VRTCNTCDRVWVVDTGRVIACIAAGDAFDLSRCRFRLLFRHWGPAAVLCAAVPHLRRERAVTLFLLLLATHALGHWAANVGFWAHCCRGKRSSRVRQASGVQRTFIDGSAPYPHCSRACLILRANEHPRPAAQSCRPASTPALGGVRPREGRSIGKLLSMRVGVSQASARRILCASQKGSFWTLQSGRRQKHWYRRCGAMNSGLPPGPGSATGPRRVLHSPQLSCSGFLRPRNRPRTSTGLP